MAFEPDLDRRFLIEELAFVLDERLRCSQGSSDSLQRQVRSGEMLRREADRFARAESVPEAHEEKYPVPLSRGFRLSQEREDLLASEVGLMVRCSRLLRDGFSVKARTWPLGQVATIRIRSGEAGCAEMFAVDKVFGPDAPTETFQMRVTERHRRQIEALLDRLTKLA